MPCLLINIGMYVDLYLYNQPQRPVINPKYDLFAWLSDGEIPVIFPAKVEDVIRLTLPKRYGREDISDDVWQFILWQTEEKGITMSRTIDSDWWYWAEYVH